jgi:hypothetical protein
VVLMSDKQTQQVNTILEEDGELWQGFQRYMEYYGVETKSDAMRMVLRDACDPHRPQRQIARTMIYSMFTLVIAYSGLLLGLIISPETLLLAQLAQSVAMTIIIIGALLPAVVIPIARHTKNFSGHGYLEQLRMAIPLSISSGPQVPE